MSRGGFLARSIVPLRLWGGLWAGLSPAVAWAGPNEGEARAIHRDVDRVYTVVAGEADGASTTTNPANLGFLRGISGVIDFAWMDSSARRRGSGVAAQIGIPLPFRIAALGFAYQFLYPVQSDAGPVDPAEPQPQNVDEPFSKVTFALSIPFERWVRGLSIGANYSRLISGTNFHAQRLNQFDVGVSYWASRFLALGLVGRALNVPQSGPSREVTQPFVIEPEFAVRPLGTQLLEFAAGMRISPRVPSASSRFRVHRLEPRGRVIVDLGPAKLFAEAERFRYLPAFETNDPVAIESRDAVRFTAGVEVNFPHVGLASGLAMSGGGRSGFAADGGVARLRFSQERYERGIKAAPLRVTKIPLASFGGDRGMWRLIEMLEEEATRRGVVVLETQGMPHAWAQVEEIREALLRLRLHGGKVAVYMEGGALRHYFLATAADRVYAHPSRSLSILGMRIQSFYFAELLARLGAKAEFVRIGEYKGYPDVVERDSASAPVARMRKQYMSDGWNHVLRLVARDRGHDPLVVKSWIDEAPLPPSRALALGVVDELAQPDELDARLERWLRRKVRLAKPSEQKEHAVDYGPPMRVAVLVIEGDLVAGESFDIPLLGRKVAGSYTITREIERLRKDKAVRAVVVRCNTPGGDVGAAEAISRELDLTRQVKPVIISMGTLCASAGYHISTAGQYIFADATTLTGSIGIFYPKMDLSGTLEKFGIGVDEADFGANASLRSWFDPYSEAERRAAQRDIYESYVLFTRRVAEARGMTSSQVDEVARGRVWSGVRAQEVGLVDAYGGIREAVLRARATAGLLPHQGEIVLVPERPGILENLRRLFGFQIPSPFGEAGAKTVGVPWLGIADAGGLGLAAPVLAVLRQLPVNLWLVEGPSALALGEEVIVIAD